MGRAMISIQSSCAIPMYYMSISEEARDLQVPGHAPLSETPPIDQQGLVQPELRLCSWLGTGLAARLRVPDAVENRWGAHPKFSEAY
eukprot:12427256-Karenia_brevis.AAC.1